MLINGLHFEINQLVVSNLYEYLYEAASACFVTARGRLAGERGLDFLLPRKKNRIITYTVIFTLLFSPTMLNAESDIWVDRLYTKTFLGLGTTSAHSDYITGIWREFL